jgi:hypothetical protein
MNFNFVTVTTETILGENEEFDKSFFEYLDEYSISHKILESKGENKWPLVEYTGGALSISNMLKERFGMGGDEIDEIYPGIKKNQDA